MSLPALPSSVNPFEFVLLFITSSCHVPLSELIETVLKLNLLPFAINSTLLESPVFFVLLFVTSLLAKFLIVTK